MNPATRSALTVLLALALVGTVTIPGIATSGDAQAVPLGTSGEYVVPGEYLVHVDSPDHAIFAGFTVEPIGFDIYKLTEDPTTDPLDRAATLSTTFGTQVVPNRVSRLWLDNPEPAALNQWSLENVGQFGGTVDADIDGEEAWDAATGDGIVVAVIDSGLDMDHEDIVDNLWVNPGEVPNNGIDDDGNGFVDDVNGWDFVGGDNNPQDAGLSGHGTAVAGIIAAPFNGVGIAGVAPDATIMVLRACGALFCEDDDAIQALYYAANNGADVINMSFGRDSGGDTAFEIAVQNAVDLGAVVVAAAGNGGIDGIGDDNDVMPITPASLGVTGLLAVAMTDDDDLLSPGSNFGDQSVHLGAPGVSMYSLGLNDTYVTVDGTSFASPTTAGVAALVLEYRGCFGPAQVSTVLQNKGDAVPALDGTTISGKRLNAFESLALTAKKNDVVILPAPAPVSFRGGNGGTTWTFGDGATANGTTAQHVYALGRYFADDGTNTYEIAAGLDFLDTCDNTFVDEIMWLSASGITLGCDIEPNFCPNDTVIRSHMASFLARALDLPPASEDYFTDDDGSSHEDNINRLREAGVTLGCNAEGTLFCPDDDVSREQMASFLARALGLVSSGFDWFTDDDGTHEDNINALADSGITLGCEEGLFCPKAGIQRDEMAAFLFRGRSYLP